MRKSLLFTFFVLAALFMTLPMEKAEAAPTLKVGSTVGDVWDLQFRLNILGYYQQKPDGVYGLRTSDAVRRFQTSYGLPPDGVTGPKTWRVLKRISVNQKELDIMAKIIHGEARGESYKGQVAVGAVVMNRVKSPLFPNNVTAVVFEPRAFTAVDDGQYWLTPNSTSYRAAIDAIRGWDPSGGALYYFNPDTATSAWIWSRPQLLKIGKHIFCS
ncbi:spore cortex-lytic enzyme [Ammoniphilus sp. CFH 90114]|uniref:spore cortex-lytic enzyme n=1 Tax=Ammoniphilus sp. CFH 90114 TaxID=2493665 RepID=UPI00100E9558|nr:spore cortex-lytic enzyme [Ammoniphilus sp. CFH 90114]RXT02886.1 spore cortex-lytic enzyme [Ammoniphilus sp. CFH 90114]